MTTTPRQRLNAVITSAPINKSAALVTSAAPDWSKAKLEFEAAPSNATALPRTTISRMDVEAALHAIDGALVALEAARTALRAARAVIEGRAPAPTTTRQRALRRVAVSETQAQVLSVLNAAGEPIVLPQIARLLAQLRGEADVAKPRGGTRFTEIARHALVRLINRGFVARVEPDDPREYVRFVVTEQADKTNPF